jgi:hypothetical protein
MVLAMKKALLPILSLILCLFAAGCTDGDWNHVLNYGGLGSGDEAASPVQPATEAPAATAAAGPAQAGPPSNAEFCRGVALQDATRNGFDEPTQKQVFLRSYTQCVATYTR